VVKLREGVGTLSKTVRLPHDRLRRTRGRGWEAIQPRATSTTTYDDLAGRGIAQGLRNASEEYRSTQPRTAPGRVRQAKMDAGAASC